MKHRMIECLLPEDFREHLRGLVVEVGSQTKVARMFGMSLTHMSNIINEKRRATPVARLLGYVERTVYVREPQERRGKVRGGRANE